MITIRKFKSRTFVNFGRLSEKAKANQDNPSGIIQVCFYLIFLRGFLSWQKFHHDRHFLRTQIELTDNSVLSNPLKHWLDSVVQALSSKRLEGRP